jgi:hypothetical protein
MEFLVKRGIDFIWLLLILYFYYEVSKKNNFKFNVFRLSYLFLIMAFISLVSTINALFFLDVNIVFSDIFEAYRWVYYFLVINMAFQIKWNHYLFNRYLVQATIAALSVVFIITYASLFNANLNQFFSAFYYFKTQSLWSDYVRVSGTFTNPNFFGVFLVFALSVITLGGVMETYKKYLYILLTIGLVFLTGSRTGMIGAFAIFTYVFIMVEKYSSWKSLIQKFSLLVSAVILFSFASTSLSRVYRTIDAFAESGFSGIGSLSVKYEYGLKLLRMVNDLSPIIGLGGGKGFGNYLGDSQLISIIFSYGNLGLFIYSLFWALFIYKVYKIREYRQLSIFLVLFFIFGFVGEFFFMTQIGTTLLLFYGALLSFKRKEIKKL